MTTTKQLERMFKDGHYRRMYQELVSGRPEVQMGLDAEFARPVPLAAWGIIRLDELTQPHVPLYRRFLNVILTAQQSDGGWGDPLITALCLRALFCCQGQGSAIDQGIQYLASMQKTRGIWPREPIRRMPADPLVSAFVMLQIGGDEAFRSAVRFDDAVDWFAANEQALDPNTARLWSHAMSRCRLTHPRLRFAPLWAA